MKFNDMVVFLMFMMDICGTEGGRYERSPHVIMFFFIFIFLFICGSVILSIT